MHWGRRIEHAMGLFGSRKTKVVVEVSGDKIIVRMPGTNFVVRYEMSKDGLVATSFGGRKDQDAKISLPIFLAQAWQAANDKARELNWIV